MLRFSQSSVIAENSKGVIGMRENIERWENRGGNEKEITQVKKVREIHFQPKVLMF